MTRWLDGDAPTVKSGGAVTTSVAVVVRVKLPLTPVIVIGYVPSGVVDEVLTESVEVPVDGFGEKEPAAPLGNPEY